VNLRRRSREGKSKDNDFEASSSFAPSPFSSSSILFSLLLSLQASVDSHHHLRHLLNSPPPSLTPLRPSITLSTSSSVPLRSCFFGRFVDEEGEERPWSSSLRPLPTTIPTRSTCDEGKWRRTRVLKEGGNARTARQSRGALTLGHSASCPLGVCMERLPTEDQASSVRCPLVFRSLSTKLSFLPTEIRLPVRPTSTDHRTLARANLDSPHR
jgi:hypothetical protein